MLFSDQNGICLPYEVVQALAQGHAAQGKTDNGEEDIAVRLDKPVVYYDPGLPVTHSRYLATNTLQEKRFKALGFLTDPDEVERLRAEAQAAKAQEV